MLNDWDWAALLGLVTLAVSILVAAAGIVRAQRTADRQEIKDLREQLNDAKRETTDVKIHLQWEQSQNIELMRRLLKATSNGHPPLTEDEMVQRARDEFQRRQGG